MREWSCICNDRTYLDRNTKLVALLCADDLVVITEGENGLQWGIHSLEKNCKKYSMRVATETYGHFAISNSK